MDQDSWTAVDRHFAGRLLSTDEAMDDVLAANLAAGLPAIDVSPLQGKFLHLIARAIGARRILEIGTLGGYSTIWLARAVGEGGRVVSLEFQPRYARSPDPISSGRRSTTGSRSASARRSTCCPRSRRRISAPSTSSSSTPTRPTRTPI